MNLLILPTNRRYWLTSPGLRDLCYKRHDLLFQDLWVKEFRMSPKTFEFVVDLVRENIQKHSATFRDSMKVEKRIVIGI